MYIVLEVKHREQISATKVQTQKEAFDIANRLLKKHAEFVGCPREYDEQVKFLAEHPNSKPPYSGIGLAGPANATGSMNPDCAFCSWTRVNWDCYIIDVDMLPENGTLTF